MRGSLGEPAANKVVGDRAGGALGSASGSVGDARVDEGAPGHVEEPVTEQAVASRRCRARGVVRESLVPSARAEPHGKEGDRFLVARTRQGLEGVARAGPTHPPEGVLEVVIEEPQPSSVGRAGEPARA